jgi:pimeloyl-ACP methyl ester carboxylesterase
VADLREVVTFHAKGRQHALLGASWGAMLALAYAAAHPTSTGPLILVGCGTFDLAARAELRKTIAERLNDEIRARLKCADERDQDERMKASAEAEMSIYSYDVRASAHDEDKVDVDARAHHETWDDMVRLQTEGVYPAAFSAIKVSVLMVHGTYDPHPGRLISAGLRSYLPQLEYRELQRCGHYPWLEKAAADVFFALVHEWLAGNLGAAEPQRVDLAPNRGPKWVIERTRPRGSAVRAGRSKWRGRADQLIRRL